MFSDYASLSVRLVSRLGQSCTLQPIQLIFLKMVFSLLLEWFPGPWVKVSFLQSFWQLTDRWFKLWNDFVSKCIIKLEKWMDLHLLLFWQMLYILAPFCAQMSFSLTISLSISRVEFELVDKLDEIVILFWFRFAEKMVEYPHYGLEKANASRDSGTKQCSRITLKI